MALKTISLVEDIQNAGNLSKRIDDKVIIFYQELASYYLRDMLTDTVYDAVLNGTGSLTDIQRDKIKKSEAMITVAFCLPALAVATSAQGINRIVSLGSSGTMEYLSYAKEISELASVFLNAGLQLIVAWVEEDKYKSVWSEVILRMFPSLDEMPTVAMVGSEAEALLKSARGDVAYEPSQG